MTEIKKPELDDETLKQIGSSAVGAYYEGVHVNEGYIAATRIALDALHPHYVAANQDDGWEVATGPEDIRKGDTVERTIVLPSGTARITTGIAHNQDYQGDWRDEHGYMLTFLAAGDETYRVRRASRPELPTEVGGND